MATLTRYTVLAALFLIPFVPLYVADGMFFPFISGKGFLFRILIEIAAGSWLLLALCDKQYRPRFSWTLVLFGLFTAWMFVADFFAVNPHKAFWSNYERMDGWVTLIHVFLFFVVAGSVLSALKLWGRWWLTMLSVSALVCIYGVLQLLHANGFPIHQGGVRVDATFGNAIYLASYLLFLLPITAWQAFVRKGWMRYSLIALGILEFVILFYTATRGAIIGAVVSILVALLIWVIDSGARGKKIALGVFIAVVAIAGGFFLVKDTSFVKSEPTLARLSSFSSSEFATRFTLWGMAFKGVSERPVTGWGQEGFNYVFYKYYEPSLYAQEPWFDRAHNTYIDWFVAGGYPALLIYIGLLVVAAVALYRRKDMPKAERIMLLAAFAGYLVQAFAEFDNLMSYICIAALFAMIHAISSRPIAALERMGEPKEIHHITLAGSSLVATLVVLWVVNVPGITGASDLITALRPNQTAPGALAAFQKALSDGSFATQEMHEQLLMFTASVVTSPAVTIDEKKAFVAYAYSGIQQELKVMPHDARVHYEFALLAGQIGDRQTASDEIDAALAESPKKQNLLFEKATEYWEAGDFVSAQKLLDATYAEEPRNEQAAAYAAAGKMLNNDIPGGRALLLTRFGTTTIDSQSLVYAFFATKQYNDLILLREAQVRGQHGAPTARLQLAYAYAVGGRLQDAIAEVRATVAAHPEAAQQGAALLAQLGVK